MKRTYRNNFRIVVGPNGYSYRETTEREWDDICASIKAAIKRHVDDIASIGVAYDNNAECSHCHSKWTEASETFNGGCCAQDALNEPVEETVV